jgi:nicotinamide phosphoribosyltransferase
MFFFSFLRLISRAADTVFGSDLNRKGYKVLRKCGVIQGDGVTYQKVRDIMRTCLEAGFSAQNVAFGMGSGLLQRLHRDTMSFATKLSCVEMKNGDLRHVMKTPKTERSKFSLPGEFEIRRNTGGVPIVYAKSWSADPTAGVEASENLLRPVYDRRPLDVPVWDDFQTIRHRISTEWSSLPRNAEILSDTLKEKIRKISESNVAQSSATYEI